MERLLYEQQRTSAAERGIVAELRRARSGKPVGGGFAGQLQLSVGLMLALLALLFFVLTSTAAGRLVGDAADQTVAVLSVAAVGIFLLVVYVPSVRRLLRWRSVGGDPADASSYEFVFVLDEPTDPDRVLSLFARRRGEPLAAAPGHRRLRGAALRRLSGGQIERASSSYSTVNMSSVLTFRVTWVSHARFEIVHEILASEVSHGVHYMVHQVRVSGVSPAPLSNNEIAAVIDTIFQTLVAPLSIDGNVDDALSHLRILFTGTPRRA